MLSPAVHWLIGGETTVVQVGPTHARESPHAGGTASSQPGVVLPERAGLHSVKHPSTACC